MFTFQIDHMGTIWRKCHKFAANRYRDWFGLLLWPFRFTTITYELYFIVLLLYYSVFEKVILTVSYLLVKNKTACFYFSYQNRRYVKLESPFSRNELYLTCIFSDDWSCEYLLLKYRLRIELLPYSDDERSIVIGKITLSESDNLF